jgi:glycosyltransferase involved in cell wall biosynthesis
VKLGLFAASPFFSHTPLYRRVAQDPRIAFTAVFASDAGLSTGYQGFDGGSWGVEMLDGYRSVFLRRARGMPVTASSLAMRDPDVIRVLRQERFDVLWIYGYHSPTHVLAAATQRLLRGRLMFREEQTHLHPRSFWRATGRSAALQLFVHDADCLYIGTENRRWLQSMGVPDDRLFFTPYAADNDRLRAAADELQPRRADLLERFGLRPEVPTFLVLSRLVPKKQPELVVEAFRQARAETECQLLIVGSGPCEAEIRRQVSDSGIPDVHLAGFLDQAQIPEAYAASDVFIQFSREHETWGLVVNEAMNFGLPVIASDKVGAATDLVEEGRTGFVADHRDLEGLVRGMRALARDPARRDSMGEAARERVSGWNHDVAAREVVRAALGDPAPGR